MRSAIFTSGNQAYQVSKIIYAGSVHLIPVEHRRSDYTYSFKMITKSGTVYSYYKNEESAWKSRNMLSAMLDSLKPKSFKNGFEYIDPLHIVSFGSVVQFKKALGEFTHGFTLSLDTVQEESQEIWLRFKSEEHAIKVRKIVWAVVHSSLGLTKEIRQVQDEPVLVETALRF